MENIEIRKATIKDAEGIHALIGELALYEKAPHEFTLTVEQLKIDGFLSENPAFECLVAVKEEQVLGIALYYQKYSTWKGKCIFLDDIVVSEKCRRQGIGEKLFAELKQIAKDRKALRLEWQVLDWNEPAIQFYKKLNAVLDSEWINCKFTFEQLQNK